MAVELQIMQEPLQSGTRMCRQLFAEIADSKINSPVFPSGERQPPKTQTHLARRQSRMHADGFWRHSHNRFKLGLGSLQEGIGLADCHKPAIHISRTARINSYKNIQQRIMFV